MYLFSRPVNLDQKRQTKRLTCRYAVICEQSKSAFNGTVVDMGHQGLRMVVPRKLKSGVALNVSSAQGKSVHVEVRWCRLKRFTSIIEVGCVYTSRLEGTWVERALEELGMGGQPAERRRTVRAPISDDFRMPVQVNGHPGQVDNLGMGGACVILGSPLSFGSLAEVVVGPYYSLKPLKLKAQVVHQMSSLFPDSWSYGLGFNQLTTAQRTLLKSYIEQLLKARADS